LFFALANITLAQDACHTIAWSLNEDESKFSRIKLDKKKVFDATGKTIYILEEDFNKGYNELVIERKQLIQNGLLYYQFKSEKYNAVKKMIVVD